MKENYKAIYKRIVEAYYNNQFEEALEDILNNEFESKKKGKEIISALCGVDISNLMNFVVLWYNNVDI